MPQTRLHFTARRPRSTEWFALLERALEDDAVPVAIAELDEDEALDEISVYVEDDVQAMSERLRDLLGADGPAIDAEAVPDVDWVTRSLEGLSPVRAGRFLVHGGHDRHRRRAGDLAVEIEAGLAFGTGHHGTTAGCLEAICRIAVRERPRRVLDLGTGSGVLAIAIAKLLHVPVLATDIDPVAVDVARANARLNRTGALVSARTAPGLASPVFALHGPFDLIVANILARPLMSMAPAMTRHLASGGSLILSGILDRQRRAVIAAYVGQGFRHVSSLHRGGWTTLHLKR